MKNNYIKEIITILIFSLSTIIYLLIPFSDNDLIKLSKEDTENTIYKLSVQLNKDVDNRIGFKDSFYAFLPWSQIKEFKIQNYIYNLAMLEKQGYKMPETSIYFLNSIKHSKEADVLIEQSLTIKGNSMYNTYQLLGIISILLILISTYYVIKHTIPEFLKFYIFILTLFYFTNFVFFNLKSNKEKLIEKTLELSYYSNN